MKRDSSIDNISGLLIIYMILYHIFQMCGIKDAIDSYGMLPLSFFMFWFFYKSGMYYKDRSPKEILLGGGKKLMVPYVVFSLIGHLLQCVKMFMEGDTNWVHYVLSPLKQILLSGSLGGNLPLWFLPSLLAVQLLYTKLHKLMRDEWMVVLTLVVAFTLHEMRICKPLYIGNVSLGLAVFAFGHIMRELQYKRKIFILSGVIYLTLLFMTVGSIDFRANGAGKESYLLPVLFSLCGCIIINNIFRLSRWRIGVLKYVGERSMAFYVLHWLVLMLCRICKLSFDLSDSMTNFWLMAISCCVILPLATESLMRSK